MCYFIKMIHGETNVKVRSIFIMISNTGYFSCRKFNLLEILYFVLQYAYGIFYHLSDKYSPLHTFAIFVKLFYNGHVCLITEIHHT